MPSSQAMSEVDPDIQPSSDSFWEVGQYKTTVKRVDDGFKLCNEFMSLVQERCEIEKAYAKNLKHWAKKWNDAISKGPEYGTTQAAWRGLLEEAERVSEVHCDVKNDLLTEVHTNVKQWQKDNYRRNMVGAIKESKDFDDNFRRAQKPWAKRLSKVIKCKKDYHQCCKTEKSLKIQLANQKGDSSVPPDNIRKAQEKVDKSERDTEMSREKYNAALSDLNSYNAKYMEEMTEVFENCQEAEEKRLKFFKDIMFQMHKCLNISNKEQFPRIYEDLHSTISKTDASQDLRWWSNTYGVGMPMNWPAFEEYSPELKPINKKAAAGDGGIVLKSMRASTYNPASNHHHNNSEPAGHQNDIQRQEATTAQAQNNVNPQNPFGDEWDSQYDLVDDGRPGVTVRALYDYTALEEDELNLKAGDIFQRLSDEDSQGWCKGRKDGQCGLYPANYAEPV